MQGFWKYLADIAYVLYRTPPQEVEILLMFLEDLSDSIIKDEEHRNPFKNHLPDEYLWKPDVEGLISEH